jgi:murein DD-endopeptidase / murein LD-carboxypeptidase
MMQETRGARTARRAGEQLGVKFRLFAHCPDVALDCVGLIAHAAEIEGPFQYRLRGDFQNRISDILRVHDFESMANEIGVSPGDIIVVQTAPRQQHLMVCVPEGFVHAHAGIGCVVLTPELQNWPVLNHWRDRR